MKFAICLLLCLLLASLVGCQSLPPDRNRLEPHLAPSPFSAEDIRRGCPDGRRIRWQTTVAGRDPIVSEMLFSNPDAEGVTVSVLGPDGATMGSNRSTWSQFQGHAAYPEESTTITHEVRSTPAGEFDCWLYVESKEKDGRKAERRFWFAKSLPGPPVDMEEYLDGLLVSRMTMLKAE